MPPRSHSGLTMESRRCVPHKKTCSYDAKPSNRPRMIGDPIGSVLPQTLRRRRRWRGWRNFERSEALQAGRDGLRTMAEDILPESVDGFRDLTEVGGSC